MHFKHQDTKLLLYIALAYAVAAAGLWLWLREGGLYVALGLTILCLGGLQLHLYRARQKEDVDQLRQIQALFSLFSAIPFRHTLPPMTGWAASPELASTVYGLIREHRPKTVVELGSGVSTLVAAYALEQNGEGRLVSLDQDAGYGAATAEQLRRHGLDARAQVIHAPLKPVELDGRSWTWYDVSRLPEVSSIDLLVVDGPHRALQPLARYPAMPMLYDRLSPNAVIVLDDADRKDERAAVRRWTDEHEGWTVVYAQSPKGTAILRRA